MKGRVRMVKKITELIMYEGPSFEEIVEEAKKQKLNIELKYENETKKLIVESILPYDIVVKDIYVYDSENKLIKQILIINNKEKIVFDKYKEIEVSLLELNNIAKTKSA